MSGDRRPETGSDAWFKELENRLEGLRNKLADASVYAERSTRARQEIDRSLSTAQEVIARIEDRIASLLDGGSSDGASRDPFLPTVDYRDVPGFAGYRIGSDGSIWGSRSAGRGYGRTREWRQLKPYLVRPGPSLAVSLYRERTRHISRVDELVLLAFAGPGPDGSRVMHANGDVLDNRPENLCYVTDEGS